MGFWASDRETPAAKIPFTGQFFYDNILHCFRLVLSFYTLHNFYSKCRSLRMSSLYDLKSGLFSGLSPRTCLQRN